MYPHQHRLVFPPLAFFQYQVAIATGNIRKNDGVECLLKFDNGFYDGQPAMTCNSFGAGLAIYQGVTGTGPELLSEITGLALEKAGVKSPADCPAGVEIIDCGKAVFALNTGASPASFRLTLKAEALRGGFDAATGTVSVAAMDMCVLTRI